MYGAMAVSCSINTYKNYYNSKTQQLCCFCKISFQFTNNFRSGSGIIQQGQPCNSKSNFVCSLPEECHADVCSSQCKPKNFNYCNPPEKSVRIFQANVKGHRDKFWNYEINYRFLAIGLGFVIYCIL
jgi:hypothetical protein